MLAGLYLSFDPLLSRGCFQNSSQTRIAFLSFPLTCWELLNRTETSIITTTPSFLLRSISFFSSHRSPFWPGVLLNGVGPLKRNITSATLSLVPDTGSGRGCVDQAYTSLYFSGNELLWVECVYLNLVVLAEVRLGCYFSVYQRVLWQMPSLTSPARLILFKEWNLTVVLLSGQGAPCNYFRCRKAQMHSIPVLWFMACDSAAHVMLMFSASFAFIFFCLTK